MLIEVHTGTRPGRPRLLLFIGAGVLVGALGLAWWQVGSSRVLGPEQRVGNTPLWVRLPRDWRPHPQEPQVFILPVREPGWRRSAFDYERRIRFEYQRLPSFVPIEAQLRRLRLDAPQTRGTLRPARIGPYAAVEVSNPVRRRFRGGHVETETIVRFTCLPRGEVITIWYEPLFELRPSDIDILEDVCRTLRIEDATLGGDPQARLRQAGVAFPLENDWQVTATDFEQVPGVYLSGSIDGVPAWSIAVLRSWLAAGRTPRALLADLAGEAWLLWDIEDRLSETQRADGATLTTLRHPRLGRGDELLPSARVVARSPAQVALILVWAGPAQAEGADAVAERIAQTVQIQPLAAWPSVEEAERAGIALAAALTERGPVSRWGRESVQTRYLGHLASGDETIVVTRGAVERDPERGYTGGAVRQRGQEREEITRWSVDGRARTYELTVDFVYSGAAVSIHEQRQRASGKVERRVEIERYGRHDWTYGPGAAFVPPPTQEIIEGWVARNEPGAAIIAASSRLGPGTHTVLLRRLPPDGEYPRVLVQEDYWPTGLIEAFDDVRAELVYERGPSADYRRVASRGRVDQGSD